MELNSFINFSDSKLEITSGFNKWIYEISKKGKPWFDAQVDCNSRGGILMKALKNTSTVAAEWFKKTNDKWSSHIKVPEAYVAGSKTDGWYFTPSVLDVIKQFSADLQGKFAGVGNCGKMNNDGQILLDLQCSSSLFYVCQFYYRKPTDQMQLFEDFATLDVCKEKDNVSGTEHHMKAVHLSSKASQHQAVENITVISVVGFGSVPANKTTQRSLCMEEFCHPNNTASCSYTASKICSCFAGFTGVCCETDIDACVGSPCFRGICKDDRNSFHCQCPGGWDGSNCNIKVGFPNDTVEVVNTVSNKLGCFFIFFAIGFVLIVYIVTKNFNVDRIIKLNVLASLLATHLLVALGGDPSIFKLSNISCNAISMFNFFFTVAHFTFLEIHSRHAYYWSTGVSLEGTMGYSLPWYAWIGVGWGYAIFSTLIAAAVAFGEFGSSWACWLNYDTDAAKWTVIFVIPAISAVINAESAGLELRRFPHSITAMVDKHVFFTGVSGCASNYFMVTLSLAAYFSSTYSLHNSHSLAASALSFPLNIGLSATIVFFYVLSDREVWQTARQMWLHGRSSWLKIRQRCSTVL